jgi:hypothetical protein
VLPAENGIECAMRHAGDVWDRAIGRYRTACPHDPPPDAQRSSSEEIVLITLSGLRGEARRSSSLALPANTARNPDRRANHWNESPAFLTISA